MELAFVTFLGPRIFGWILEILFLENLRSPDQLWLKIRVAVFQRLSKLSRLGMFMKFAHPL